VNYKMLEKELISIVVPIYNVENYLRMCLDSIQNQTYQNFECLLINDGSPDNSADICREYVEKDSRFRYFEKENGGLSSARNLGIERSGGGAYITFVDSDDWLDSDYLEVLHSKIVEYDTDFVIGAYKQFNMSDNCYYMHVWDNDYYEKQWSSHELLSQLPSLELNDYSYTVSWGKLFKSSLFDQIKFNEQRRFGEDFECSFKLYLSMKSCLYIHKALYNYRVHSESMVGKVRTERQLMDDVEIRLGRIPFLIGREIDPTPYIEGMKNFLQWRLDTKSDVGEGESNALHIYREIVRSL
jgi:glycosyl transferase, family 2/glycosyl transferase family 8